MHPSLAKTVADHEAAACYMGYARQSFTYLFDPENNFGQRIWALEIPCDVQDAVARICGNAGGDQRLQNAAQRKQADAFSCGKVKASVAHMKNGSLFGTAAGTLNLDRCDLEVLQFHIRQSLSQEQA
jgi:hypothetical protein